MKNRSFTYGLLAFLVISFTSVFAQKGVWVPAGGDIEGFQLATGIYQNNLYVSAMDYKSGMPKSYIKKFNGVVWTTLAEIGGFNNSISVMKEYNGELYVGGQFMEFEGITNANGLVKWNGSKWSAVGAGFDKASFAQIRAMEVFNNKLYVGGGFDSIAGIKLKNLAVWDGTNWTAGPTCKYDSGRYSIVQSLKVFNSSLFIGGTFEKVNSVSCKNVARFDGTTAYSLSNGTTNGTNSEVAGFEAFKNELYLYGYFSMLDTIPVNGIAKWDNSLIKKLTKQPTGSIQSMKTLGDNLYSCGAGWNSNVEFFDGSNWDVAGQTKLVGEGAKLEVYKNRLYVFGGFISSDSSSFVFAGSAMLIDESDACKVEGVVFLDSDKSCTKNNGEKGIPKRIVEIKPIGLKIFTDSIGYFSLFLEKGNYSAKVLPYPYYYKTCTDSIAFSFTNKGEKTDTLFLGSYVKDTVFDGSVKITSGNARPGFGISYTLNIGNVGTASQNCTLRVVLDNNFTYSSVSGTAYSRYSSNVMEWDIKPLGVKQTIKLAINGTVKSGTTLGTTMKTFASIIATSDANIKNNLDSAVNIVRGSFDPNDKQVFPAGTGTNGFVGTNTKQTLRYHIRFQNTGTDTAFNILVIDTLSSNVDISSFEEVGASHPYTYELLSGNVLKFTFNNVLLPDSNTNKALSNGYISFNINPKNGLAVGSKIRNNADIYFDFNEPVRTNTTITTFDNAASIKPIVTGQNKLKIYPNPGSGIATIKLGQAIGYNETVALEITDIYGKVVLQTNLTDDSYNLDISGYINSVYIIKISRSTGETVTGRYIKTN